MSDRSSTASGDDGSVAFIDDKTPIVVPFLLGQLERHRKDEPGRPMVVGLNGIQGVGKTTLVNALQQELEEQHGLRVVVCSIDDFYLPHHEQVALARHRPEDALLQHRGQPGTHDVALAISCISDLCEGQSAWIPRYDKSAFDGAGDRLPAEEGTTVLQPPPVDVVVLEGWCVGFRPVGAAELTARQAGDYGDTTTLHKHRRQDLMRIDYCLATAYADLFDLLDVFVHVDAEDPGWAYDWRVEQERELRERKGTGMSDDEVVRFVDGYFPAYELYLDRVRQGILKDDPEGRQLRLVVDAERRVISHSIK